MFVIGNVTVDLGFCALIALAKIAEISIQSIKTVSMVKGQRILAAVLAFIECLIWGLVCSSIITGLTSNISWLLSYCLGYAAGIYIGSKLESMIALGTSSLQLVVRNGALKDLEEYLQNDNQGYTVLEGRGAKEKSSMVIVALPRKEVKKTLADIEKICGGNVFVLTSEVSKYTGGYGVRK